MSDSILDECIAGDVFCPEMTDFNVYRLQDDEANPDRFVETGNRAVETHDAVDGPNFSAKLFVERSFRRRPPWMAFVEAGFPDALPWAPSESIGALLVVQVTPGPHRRNFALAFGQSGPGLLKEGTYRRRWGLKAALNLVSDPNAPPRLRAFDTTRHGQNILRSRLQATVPGGLEIFELDVFRDLVRQAVGQSADEA